VDDSVSSPHSFHSIISFIRSASTALLLIFIYLTKRKKHIAIKKLMTVVLAISTRSGYYLLYASFRIHSSSNDIPLWVSQSLHSTNARTLSFDSIELVSTTCEIMQPNAAFDPIQPQHHCQSEQSVNKFC
jgi:hypothetical protein